MPVPTAPPARRPLIRRLAAPALALALAGCSDAAHAPTALAPVASRQDAAPQGGAGAIVERFRGVDLGFLSILDAESGIGFTAGLTTSLADYCATGAFAATAATVQIVATPSGKNQLLVQGRNAPIVVYDYTAGAASLNPCDLVGRRVLATGTGSFTQTQSGFPPERYDAHAHAAVTLVGGGRAQLTGTEHYRAEPGRAPVVRSEAKLTGAGAR